MYEYLENNKILKEEQAGFRPNRSIQDILLRTIDDWKSALDNGHVVATVMIDLSKAFNTINHKLLIKKLDAYGICGVELSWFSDYLSGRKQRVVLGGELSDWTRLTKGVPQGSILGPMLFLVFVNNLSDVVEHCTVNLYADDTIIYSTDEDPVVLGTRIEKDLGRDRVATCIKMNGLKMNVSKTQLMVVTRKGKRHMADDVIVKIEDTSLLKPREAELCQLPQS